MIDQVIDRLQRNGMRLTLTGLILALGGFVIEKLVDTPGWVGLFGAVGIVLVLIGLALVFLFPGKDLNGGPIAVASPIRGRWLAINSPTTKVPSHGVRAYGQTYAIDLCFDPLEGPRPAFGTGWGMSRPVDYPGFGQPVFAMVDGIVVKASDWQRDHLTRTRLWSVLYLTVEASLRELRGADGVIGNQVVIDRGDGVFALVAHLKQGSTTVRVGDRVRAGEVIGACGNSGNTTEPHVHAQLMDRSKAGVARGVPMSFDGADLPANEEYLNA